MDVLLLILSFSLLVAPGAWIAFMLFDDRTPYVVRLALAVAFTPVCLGLQILLATQLGLTFAQAAFASLLNIAALWWMRPRTAAVEVAHPPVWPIITVSALLATGLSLLWLFVPLFREYSWHNMMQLAIVYGIADWPKPLEELDMAGLPVAYAYVGHIQIAAIGRIGDLSPLKIFPIVNVAMLFATLALLTHAVERLRPGHLATASCAVAVAILSTNLAGVVYYAGLLGAPGPSDPRVATLLQKYMHFDTMTIGQALFAGLIFLTIVWLKSRERRALIGMIVCLVAVSLIYPLLFPPSLLLAGTALFAWQAGLVTSGKRLLITTDDVWALLGIAATGALFVAHVLLLASPGGSRMARIATVPELWWNLKIAFFASLFWLPLVMLSVVRAWRRRETASLCLLLAAGASVGLSLVVFLSMHSHYKFLVAAFFILLPLVVVQALDLLTRLGRFATPVGAAITLGIAMIMLPYMTRALVPWDLLRTAAPIEERGFYIRPVPGADTGWIAAVRDQTPPDSVLVSPPSLDPVSIWSRRASYLAQDVGTEQRPGYSMPTKEILTGVKSLPRRVVDERAAVMQVVYGGEGKGDFSAVLDQLAQLGRPIAIYGDETLPFLQWLRARGLGRAVFLADGRTVWLVGDNRRPADGQTR